MGNCKCALASDAHIWYPEYPNAEKFCESPTGKLAYINNAAYNPNLTPDRSYYKPSLTTRAMAAAGASRSRNHSFLSMHFNNRREKIDQDYLPGPQGPNNPKALVGQVIDVGDHDNNQSLIAAYNNHPDKVASVWGAVGGVNKDSGYTPVLYINNVDLYLAWLTDQDQSLDPIHSSVKEGIRNLITSARDQILDPTRGWPGLHAEIKAVNEYLLDSSNAGVKNVAVATFRLHRNSQGPFMQDFVGCANCSYILQHMGDGVEVDVVTGVLPTDPPVNPGWNGTDSYDWRNHIWRSDERYGDNNAQ